MKYGQYFEAFKTPEFQLAIRGYIHILARPTMTTKSINTDKEKK